MSKKSIKTYRADRCLNCDTPLDVSDNFCHFCGQKHTSAKLSFSIFFREFFSNLFSYDSRLSHTISALFRPGKISKDYIEGKRARYANPFRFYLSISILFFLISGLFLNMEKNLIKINNNDFELIFEDVKTDTSESRKKTTDIIDSTLHTGSREKGNNQFTESELDTLTFFTATKHRLIMYQLYFEKSKEYDSGTALSTLGHDTNWFNRTLYKRVTQFSNIGNSISDYFNFIIGKLAIIIFFFLPIFALASWVVYFRSPFNYMEHLIFIFHQQSVLFLLFAISMLLNEFSGTKVFTKVATLLFLFYLYKALHKFYGQSYLKTTVKFLILNILFVILATIGSVVTLMISFLLF